MSTTKFGITADKTCHAIRPPASREGSERMRLYRIIEQQAGLSVQEVVTRANGEGIQFIKPPLSRIAELYHTGCIDFNRNADLFKE